MQIRSGKHEFGFLYSGGSNFFSGLTYFDGGRLLFKSSTDARVDVGDQVA